MSKGQSKKANILAKALQALSEEEQDELLELLDKKEAQSKKEVPPNKFLDMDLSGEDTRMREISKKLTKGIKKTPRREEVKMVDVQCSKCGKGYTLPANYPNIEKFICCF